ncbi:MAG: HypC/HybG/HupF family hydrogenase formation chaperone [Dehalococcoidia bacterium]
MCLGTAGTVVALHESAGLVMATVDFPYAPTMQCLSYVEDLACGDRVLVAGGAVIERVTEEEATERNTFGAMLLGAWEDLTNEPTNQPTEGLK